jgi:hypothetical protein
MVCDQRGLKIMKFCEHQEKLPPPTLTLVCCRRLLSSFVVANAHLLAKCNFEQLAVPWKCCDTCLQAMRSAYQEVARLTNQ